MVHGQFDAAIKLHQNQRFIVRGFNHRVFAKQKIKKTPEDYINDFAQKTYIQFNRHTLNFWEEKYSHYTGRFDNIDSAVIINNVSKTVQN